MANGWAPYRYAVLAGVPDASTRDMDAAEWKPTLRTLEKLEALIPEGWQPGELVPGTSSPPAVAGAAAASATAGDNSQRAGSSEPPPPITARPMVRAVLASLDGIDQTAVAEGVAAARTHEGGRGLPPHPRGLGRSHER